MRGFLKKTEKKVRLYLRGKRATAATHLKYKVFEGARPLDALASASSAHRAPGAAVRGKIYVQIGAGAGDQDSRAGNRDGFSEFVKALPRDTVGAIVLIEPNPLNIPALKRCWETYPQAEIYQYGIVPRKFSGQTLNFYYSPLDAPHYQVASVNPDHVLKHYKNLSIADLRIMPVETIDLLSLVEMAVGDAPIELLGLDIEGIDAEVLLDTDLGRLNANSISVEHLHLGENAKAVQAHFKKFGFVRSGSGVDHNEYDWLYTRPKP